MVYRDLENDKLPLEVRVKHLEREAGYVREAFANMRQNWYNYISVAAIIISLFALLK